jgi:hypothetical protein
MSPRFANRRPDYSRPCPDRWSTTRCICYRRLQSCRAAALPQSKETQSVHGRDTGRQHKPGSPSAMEGAVRNIHVAFVIASILGIAGMLIGPASAACIGLFAACPPPDRGCVWAGVNDRPHCNTEKTKVGHIFGPGGKIIGTKIVHYCIPAAQCHYTGDCGQHMKYAKCLDP